MTALEIARTFTEDNLPDLDVVTLAALELFIAQPVPQLDRDRYQLPLVVGSVNALSTGHVLFQDRPAIFANESDFARKLDAYTDIDGAYVISASGSKHAIGIAQELQHRSVPMMLLTNNVDAPAQAFVRPENVLVYPKNREPYSYNTSTYLGMILGVTGEDPQLIHDYIVTCIDPILQQQTVAKCGAFTLIVPSDHGEICSMLRVKFEELFGPKLVGHAFTEEEVKHAKTIVNAANECFVSFGVENDRFGTPDHRFFIPLPENAQFGAVMAVTYYVMGHIQKHFPPYFKDGIVSYSRELGEMFGGSFSPIVE